MKQIKTIIRENKDLVAIIKEINKTRTVVTSTKVTAGIGNPGKISSIGKNLSKKK